MKTFFFLVNRRFAETQQTNFSCAHFIFFSTYEMRLCMKSWGRTGSGGHMHRSPVGCTPEVFDDIVALPIPVLCMASDVLDARNDSPWRERVIGVGLSATEGIDWNLANVPGPHSDGESGVAALCSATGFIFIRSCGDGVLAVVWSREFLCGGGGVGPGINMRRLWGRRWGDAERGGVCRGRRAGDGVGDGRRNRSGDAWGKACSDDERNGLVVDSEANRGVDWIGNPVPCRSSDGESNDWESAAKLGAFRSGDSPRIFCGCPASAEKRGVDFTAKSNETGCRRMSGDAPKGLPKRMFCDRLERTSGMISIVSSSNGTSSSSEYSAWMSSSSHERCSGRFSKVAISRTALVRAVDRMAS